MVKFILIVEDVQVNTVKKLGLNQKRILRDTEG